MSNFKPVLLLAVTRLGWSQAVADHSASLGTDFLDQVLSSSAGPVAEGTQVVATVVQKGVMLTRKPVRISSLALQSLLPRCDFSRACVL